MPIKFQLDSAPGDHGRSCLIVKCNTHPLLTVVYENVHLEFEKRATVRQALTALETALGDAVEVHFSGRAMKIW